MDSLIIVCGEPKEKKFTLDKLPKTVSVKRCSYDRPELTCLYKDNAEEVQGASAFEEKFCVTCSGWWRNRDTR